MNRQDNKIICVGRLVSQKNYTKLLYDFKNFSDEFEIDIVGSGEKEEELKNYQKNLELR